MSKRDLYLQVAGVLGKYADSYLLQIEEKHYKCGLDWNTASLVVFKLINTGLSDNELYMPCKAAKLAIGAAKFILKTQHQQPCHKGWLPVLPIEKSTAVTLFQVNVLSHWIVSVCLLPPWKRPK